MALDFGRWGTASLEDVHCMGLCDNRSQRVPVIKAPAPRTHCSHVPATQAPERPAAAQMTRRCRSRSRPIIAQCPELYGALTDSSDSTVPDCPRVLDSLGRLPGRHRAWAVWR